MQTILRMSRAIALTMRFSCCSMLLLQHFSMEPCPKHSGRPCLSQNLVYPCLGAYQPDACIYHPMLVISHMLYAIHCRSVLRAMAVRMYTPALLSP